MAYLSGPLARAAYRAARAAYRAAAEVKPPISAGEYATTVTTVAAVRATRRAAALAARAAAASGNRPAYVKAARAAAALAGTRPGYGGIATLAARYLEAARAAYLSPPALAEIYAAPLKPFTANDYAAYAGVEGENPLISYYGPGGAVVILNPGGAVAYAEIYAGGLRYLAPTPASPSGYTPGPEPVAAYTYTVTGNAVTVGGSKNG